MEAQTKMKLPIYILAVGAAVAMCASESKAQGYFTPRFGGGYNYYDNTSRFQGYTTPRFGGGYNIYDGYSRSQGYFTPRFGGGYNFYPY